MYIGEYESAQREKARQLKRKFYPHQPVKMAAMIIDLPAFLPVKPQWRTEPMHFDDHMFAWRRELDERTNPIRAYIGRRAAQLGYTMNEIMAKSRLRELSYARFTIIWEIKRLVRPTISYPELGRHFKLDHSSVHHAVKTVDQWKAEKLAGESIDV